jgi:hypothetical protein
VNTDNVVNHLRVLWRTDRIIADIRLRHLLWGFGLRALAALLAVFGLLMFELAAYFWLIQIWSAITAAAVLGAIDVAIAVILLAFAARSPSGRELELANEVHGASIEALQFEARAFQSNVAGALNNPLDVLVPHLLVPLVGIIIKTLRGHSSSGASQP